MAIIEVNHVSKEYHLGQLQTLRQSLQNGLARLRGLPPVERELFKALDDIDFQIEKGEVVGIIGTNGAGKSTLLKILSGITKPTQGQAKVHGKVAPLIEVGAGLNPELTGRENVFLNGAILGIPRKEIQRKLGGIIEFAELEQFIDTPVKRYSSGMKVRLGFSIATSVDADILIIDEVLAVGDLAFQRKCFDRMEELIKRQGRTVLLVSHNLRHVERICSRVLLLDYGSLIDDGEPSAVCNHFYQKSDEKISQQKQASMIMLQGQIRTSGEAELLDVQIKDTSGQVVNEVTQGANIKVSIRYKMNRAFTKPVFALGIHTTDFIYLATTRSVDQICEEEIGEGVYRVECLIKDFPFSPGVYALRVDLIVGDLYSTAFRAENLKPFQVISPSVNRSEIDSSGFVSLDVAWCMQKVSSSDDESVQSPTRHPKVHSEELHQAVI